MSDYTPTTDFSIKDTLPTGDTNKIIKGSDFDIEFEAIETAVATKYDSATLGISSGSSLIGYLPEGTGAVATTVQAKLRETASVKDFGAVGDNSANDTAAINLAIAALNAGEIGGIFFPSGQYRVDSALTAIEADDWVIKGDGAFIRLVNGTTPALGTVFTIGSTGSTSYVDNWIIEGFTFVKDNPADLTGTENAINIIYGSDGWVKNCNVVNTAGLVTLGNDSAPGTCARIRFENIEGALRGDRGGKAINIVRSTGHRFKTVRLSCNTGYLPVASGFRVINIVPTGATTVIDSGVFIDCEFNLPDQSVETIMEVGISTGLGCIITNHFFTNCIFDHAIDKSIYLHIDSGATATARLSNFVFTGCRAVCEDAGGPIYLDNTGAETMFDISFNGGFYNTYDEPAVRINSDLVFCRFNSVRFSDVYPTTTKPVIETASGNITISNCVAMRHNTLTASGFTYGVSFTAAVNGFVIIGNNFDACTVGDVDTRLLNDSSSEQRLIVNNLAPANSTNFYQKLTDATPTIIASHVLPEAGAYHVTATVIGTEVGGANRASYVLHGTFYRDTGGNVTLQGSVTTSHSVESDAAWAATMTNSTTAAQVRVTGAAATNISWGCHLDVLFVPYNP